MAAAVDSLVDAEVDFSQVPYPQWAQDVGNGDGLGYNFRQHQTVDWVVRYALKFPLAGKMFKFFIDHFPIAYSTINEFQRYIYFYGHFDLLRTHGLGNFGELVRDVSWSEAMMRMLNLDSNRRGVLNENFGRELLELFTLGVGGGYTESDVTNCARAFTGRFLPASVPADHPYTAFLNTDVYPNGSSAGDYRYIDFLEKTILGKTFPRFQPNGGELEEHGDQVITHILEQPACGIHMAKKLWRYFVSPAPDDETIAILGDRFRVDYGYEVKPLLKDIFKSRAFYAEEFIGQQIKDPIDLVVGTAKALEVGLPSPSLLYAVLNELGMNLLFPPNIAGWPEPEVAGNQWLTAGAAMLRMNLPLLWTQGDYGYLSDVDRSHETAIHAPVDPESLLKTELLGERNFSLFYEDLVDRLLPVNRPEGSTERMMHDLLFRRGREMTGAETRKTLSEFIRQLMSLPEFQLQ